MTSERVGALTPDARLYEVNRRSSAYIRWVQQSLNRIMGSGLVTDGVMGPHTRNAVRAFQGQRGLVADGVVGPRTEAALVAAGAASPPGSGGAPAGGPNLAVSTPLPTPGPGYYSYKPTSQQFGLAETIRALQHIGAGWERDHPQGPRIGIGDISKRGGGPMPGHASHQRGVDADIRPARSDGHETAVSYQSAAYSRALTQELVNLIRGNGVLRVQYIFFNDPSVMDVQRWPNHDDHLHVRFYAPGAEPRHRLSETDPEVNRRSSAYIRWVQESLNRIIGSGLITDGVMGPHTRNAVRAFQGQRGLVADGVVGPRTEAALVAAGASPPPGSGLQPTPVPVPPSPAPTAVCRPTGLTAPETTVLALTSRLETGAPFRCVVSSVDGISMGMLQWNLAAGTLQRLLRSFSDTGGRLEDFFGDDTARLWELITLREPRLAVLEATRDQLAARWRRPLLRLCGDPRFCHLTTEDARARLRRAESVAAELGLDTTRGLSMVFDIDNGDGMGAKKVRVFRARIAARAAEIGRPLTEREQLVEIANAAADQLKKYREERRARRLLIAKGSGRYRNSNWDLDAEFPTLDERWR